MLHYVFQAETKREVYQNLACLLLANLCLHFLMTLIMMTLIK